MKKPKELKYTPLGYSTYVTNCGIKDKTLDLGVVYSMVETNAAAVFTKSEILGKPLIVGKKNIKNGKIQSVIVNSKNANVATGKEGLDIAQKICDGLAKGLNIKPGLVFPSSTGVIGRRLPYEKVLKKVEKISMALKEPPDFKQFARSIMTTDTFPKFISVIIDNVTLVGVAKGSGMIEPNMATMLSYFFTDAQISAPQLRAMLKRVVAKTFNCLSVDTDTSTSDTVLIMANGIAGKVNLKKFETAFLTMAKQLTKWLAFDGEGATKLFEVEVKGARNEKEARAISKSIINSPLVKTAIYKGDPNWGRITMAIGKTGIKVKEEKIELLWGNTPKKFKDADLARLSKYLKSNTELKLTVKLNLGRASATAYGCDLTEEYVKINAYYTT